MAKFKEKIGLLKKHPYFRCKFSLIMLFNSLLLNLSLWMLLYFRIKPSNFPVPLHYSVYFGIDNIDYWYKVFFVPGIGVLFIFLNLFLCIWFYNKERFITHFLSVNNFVVQGVLFGFVIPLVFMQT